MLSSFIKICQYAIYGSAILSGVGLLTAAYGEGTEHELVRQVGMSPFWSGIAFFLLAKGAGILVPTCLTVQACGFHVPKEKRFSIGLWIFGGIAMMFYGFLVLCLAWEKYFHPHDA